MEERLMKRGRKVSTCCAMQTIKRQLKNKVSLSQDGGALLARHCLGQMLKCNQELKS